MNRRRTVNKRAAIEMQFNWIFILVIGGLIITFFFLAITKHKDSTELEIDVEVRSKLQTILTSGQQSSSTTYTITLPHQELEFDCEGFTIGNLQPIKFKHAFAPSLLKAQTNKLTVMALPYSLPYKIDNFLYVTSNDVRYIFYNTSNSAGVYLQSLMEDREAPSMPSNISKELVQAGANCGGITNTYHYQVKFIFFDDGTGTLTNTQINECANALTEPGNQDITAIKIKPIEGALEGRGEIQFYRKNSAGFSLVGGVVPYMGRESLIGAAISGKKDAYLCAMNEMTRRQNMITFNYWKKAKLLEQHYLTYSGSCDAYYNSAYTALKLLQTATKRENAFSTNAYDIYNAAKQVKNANKRLALRTCPLIY